LKIILENVIASIRVLTGAFGFFIFLFVGVLVGAEPMVLLLGGLIFGAICYVFGNVLANILKQIDSENQLNPIESEEEKKEGRKKVDFFQDMELPGAK